MQEEHSQSVKESSPWADIWEMAWFPVLLALLAMGVTWAVWYYTAEPGEPESKQPAGCNWNKPEKCIGLNVLNKMFTHGAIAGGAGGVSFYIMLRRERLAREAAERRLDEERRRADDERRRADDERRRLLDRIAELETQAANNGQERTSSE